LRELFLAVLRISKSSDKVGSGAYEITEEEEETRGKGSSSGCGDRARPVDPGMF
jgi:hypothetical protein